jgi:diguanylate cyclase (GGDEF)-like protein
MTESGGVVLVVDDAADDIELMSDVLEQQHHVIYAANSEEALSLARSQTPDLILLDPDLEGGGGIQLCRRLKEDPLTATVPVIFVTRPDPDRDEAEGLELGAIDYIGKPINPSILRARVRNYLELLRSREQLELFSSNDPVTGLANRRRFDAVLATEIARHRRNGDVLSLLLVDIDDFIPYKDHHGSVVAEASLRRVGLTLAGAVRRSCDLVARYGVAEFACILPETDHAGALQVAEKMRAAVADLGRPVGGLTISVGVIASHCDDGLGAHELVALADSRLYSAKAEGGNRVSGFEAVTAE